MPNSDPYIRLVCEGQKTEPNYFNGLLSAKGLKIPKPAFKPKDHSPLGIAREAKRLYKEAVKRALEGLYELFLSISLNTSVQSLKNQTKKLKFYFIKLHLPHSF